MEPTENTPQPGSEPAHSAPRTLACPTCGAPLFIPSNTPTIRCRYCSSLIENPEYQPPQPQAQHPAPAVRTVTPIQIDLRPAMQAAPKAAGCAGGVFVVAAIVLVLIIGGGIFLVSKLSAGGVSIIPEPVFPLQIHNPASLVSTGSTPNIISPVYSITKNSYGLARLDISTHKVLWTTLEQADFLSIDQIIMGNSMAYLVIKDRLLAINLADGTQAWTASLPDGLPGRCESCIVLYKGQVVVDTLDDSLGAYDALTGHQTWEKQFGNAGDKLYPVGDGVAVAYSTDRGAALVVLDVANGSELAHIEPTCGREGGMTDEMDVYSKFVIDDSSQPVKAYLFFGFFSACVQRWDLASGAMEWENYREDENLSTSNDTPILLAGDRLIYVQDYQLRSIDTATGQDLQIIDDQEDYAFVPLLVDGSRLIVRAKRTRGTSRFELWGYDLATGKNIWKHPLLNSSPIDPPDALVGLVDSDESGWTLLQGSPSPWLITFQTAPNQVDVAQMSLDTGELGSQKTISLEIDDITDFYSPPERLQSSDNLAWFSVLNRIYVVDPQTGTFPYRWR